MAEDTYLMNINSFKEIFKANISYNRTRGPVISEFPFQKYVFSDETATVVLLRGYNWLTIESVEVINATSSYDPTTYTLTISNPTSENVIVNYVTCYKDSELCSLIIGAEKVNSQLNTKPDVGTITYVNKYNETVSIDLSTLTFTYNNSYHKYEDLVRNTTVSLIRVRTTPVSGSAYERLACAISNTLSATGDYKRSWVKHTYYAASDYWTVDTTVSDLSEEQPELWEQLSTNYKADVVVLGTSTHV